MRKRQRREEKSTQMHTRGGFFTRWFISERARHEQPERLDASAAEEYPEERRHNYMSLELSPREDGWILRIVQIVRNTRIARAWRTSLQVRLLISIFVTCTVAVLILGSIMLSTLTQRLLNSKVDTANGEIDRARGIVEKQIEATDSGSQLQVRLNAARAALTNRTAQSGDTSAIFDPVILVHAEDGTITTSPEGYRIPSELMNFVDQKQISYQYALVDRADGSSHKAIIIGSPTESTMTGLQVYLVLSLDNEEQTLAVVRSLFAAGGIGLVILIVGISWLFTRQIVGPLLVASRTSQRFAQGYYRERMIVKSQDEIGTMARSFNAMADELSSQIDQLKRYGDLQRRFTSDVSHELRTPLTTVRMAAGLISDHKLELDPAAQRAVELMDTELDRFEALLNDLLEISRHDAGVADLTITHMDISECVRSAWKHVQPLAAQLGVDVSFSFPSEPVLVDVDNRRIERIVRNLLANAVDHAEGKPIMVMLVANEEAVSVGVRDHGVGLRRGQEHLVFQRFWRADASRVRHSGGTGLGLAISVEDAQLHGGTLEAVGEPGVGSLFRLTVPRTPHGSYDVDPIPLTLTYPMHITETPAANAGEEI